MAAKARILIGALSLSAAGLLAIVQDEGYTDKAVRPTPLDVPTVGFGSTRKPDGKPVTMADTVTPPQALRLAVHHIKGDETILKRCAAGVMLTQAEYDIYVKFSYNVGAANFCRSTMLDKLKGGDYVGACQQFTRWRFHNGFDCSTPGNRICSGLWSVRLESLDACMQEATR